MATLPKSDPSDRGELLEVFAANSDSEAQVVQGLLDSAGIESLIVADVGPQDILPVGGVVVRVAPEFADRALQVIAESQTVSDAEMADEEDTQEFDASGAA